MPTQEIRHTLLLATLFAFRLLGLFMILPVFTLYASQYQQATPQLIGIAIGIYGLTQALLQLPFGSLSDRVGRKPIIYLGLLLFILGSLIAAFAHTISMVILGRALQGAGAIGSTLLATVADLTSPAHRTKAMAIMGIIIGASFSLALILGPIIAAHYNLSGIFFTCFFLGLIGLVMTTRLPTPTHHVRLIKTEQGLKPLLTQPLLFLNLSILLLHLLFTANFIALPIVLLDQLQISKAHQWSIYLPLLVASALLMTPFIRRSAQQSQRRHLFLYALVGLVIAQSFMTFFHQSIALLMMSLLLFFTVFNILEALLPSLVSHAAPAHARGTAMGIYSTSQFFGIFLGGSLGGLVYGQFSAMGVFLLSLSSAVLWLGLSLLFLRSLGE